MPALTDHAPVGLAPQVIRGVELVRLMRTIDIELPAPAPERQRLILDSLLRGWPVGHIALATDGGLYDITRVLDGADILASLAALDSAAAGPRFALDSSGNVIGPVDDPDADGLFALDALVETMRYLPRQDKLTDGGHRDTAKHADRAAHTLTTVPVPLVLVRGGDLATLDTIATRLA